MEDNFDMRILVLLIVGTAAFMALMFVALLGTSRQARRKQKDDGDAVVYGDVGSGSSRGSGKGKDKDSDSDKDGDSDGGGDGGGD
jgi:hypothetical protein